MARRLGLWWLNACRIVYVVDEEGPVTRFGFAYGTLPGHAGAGEERFLVEWDRASGEVWYDILAFSRPHVFLSPAGLPVHAAGPGAVREGVGGGDGEGREAGGRMKVPVAPHPLPAYRVGPVPGPDEG